MGIADGYHFRADTPKGNSRVDGIRYTALRQRSCQTSLSGAVKRKLSGTAIIRLNIRKGVEAFFCSELSTSDKHIAQGGKTK